MPLYYISNTKYNVGDLLPLKEEDNRYHKLKKEEGKEWVNDVLDNEKPEGFPFRRTAYYAFDDPDYCIYYYKAEMTGNEQVYLYEVELTNQITAPMRLTQTILNNEGKNELIEELAREYWNPTKNWNFLEYLGNTMKIVAVLEVDIDKPLFHIQERYINDGQIAKNLVKQLNN
ncbi:MAG: hypothetical protein ACX93I_01965 [Winogradskyella sp.]|jgi:hypothetical protein